MNPSPIDANTLAELKAAAGDEFIDELIGTFFEEAPLLLNELRTARAVSASERFKRAAHSLKTNAQTFGAFHLGDVARALELGGLPAADDGTLDALNAAYAAAERALQAMRHE